MLAHRPVPSDVEEKEEEPLLRQHQSSDVGVEMRLAQIANLPAPPTTTPTISMPPPADAGMQASLVGARVEAGATGTSASVSVQPDQLPLAVAVPVSADYDVLRQPAAVVHGAAIAEHGANANASQQLYAQAVPSAPPIFYSPVQQASWQQQVEKQQQLQATDPVAAKRERERAAAAAAAAAPRPRSPGPAALAGGEVAGGGLDHPISGMEPACGDGLYQGTADGEYKSVYDEGGGYKSVYEDAGHSTLEASAYAGDGSDGYQVSEYKCSDYTSVYENAGKAAAADGTE